LIRIRDNCLSGSKNCPECGRELVIYNTNCEYYGAKLIQTVIETRKRKKRNFNSKKNKELYIDV